MPDPTLTAMARFSDPSQWDHIERGVPIFVEHEMYEVAGPDGRAVAIPVLPGNKPPEGARLKYKVGREELEFITAKINENFNKHGKPMKIFVGHTLPPGLAKQEDQPALVGYGINAVLRQWGPEGRLGILADKYFEKGKFAEAKKYPERSPEFNPMTGDMTAVALLKTEPKLPMGMTLYGIQGFDGVVRYGHGFEEYAAADASKTRAQDPSAGRKATPTQQAGVDKTDTNATGHPKDQGAVHQEGAKARTQNTKYEDPAGSMPEGKNPNEPIEPEDEAESLTPEEEGFAKKLMKYMQKCGAQYAMADAAKSQNAPPSVPANTDSDGSTKTAGSKGAGDVGNSQPHMTPADTHDQNKKYMASASGTNGFLPPGLRVGENENMGNELQQVQYAAELQSLRGELATIRKIAEDAQAKTQTAQERYALAESSKAVMILQRLGKVIKKPDELAQKLAKLSDEERKAAIEDIKENYATDPTAPLQFGDFLPISFDHVEGADEPVDDSLTPEESQQAIHYAAEHRVNPKDDAAWKAVEEAIKAKRKGKAQLNGTAK